MTVPSVPTRRLPMIDTGPSERVRDVIDATRAICDQYPRSYWLQCLEEGRFMDEMWLAMGLSGLIGVGVPEEHGGQGGGISELAAMLEEFSRHGMPVFNIVISGVGRAPLLNHGTPEQIERWVVPLLDGTKKLCFAITEPTAGFNSFGMTTLAERNGSGWRLSGQKTMISGADVADWMVIVARTKPRKSVEDKRDGLSLFVLDMKSPGIDMHQLNVKMPVGEHQYTVFFDDVAIPEEGLIGVEHQGVRCMFESLNGERVLVAAMALGLGDYALQRAVEYSQTRAPFGAPIGSYQAIQHPLAHAKAQLEGARLITHRAAERLDAGEQDGLEANTAKLLASEAGLAAVEAALQCHGGWAFDTDMDILTNWPVSRMCKNGPVSNEMILNFIAEQTLGLPRSY